MDLRTHHGDGGTALDKFLISLGIQPTRADRCTYVCYDGAFKEPKQVSFADSEATEPAPVSYYMA